MNPRCAPERPVAILSFHSHGDRSFLDDRDLALLSGTLRDDGIANDLVLVVMPRDVADGDETARRLLDVLSGYDPIVYERVWSASLIEHLRAALPDRVFIGLRGEHVLETLPADIFCDGDPRKSLGALVQWLRGQRPAPPPMCFFRGSDGTGVEWMKAETTVAEPARSFGYAPNLRPVVINPELLPSVRTFSVVGNSGCPFQLDARENPLYAGIEIPASYGRGCAFCTTGNHYDGRPNDETAASVMEQIRYVRAQAPELTLIVLKDQNPFGYLTELVERCEAEHLSGFTLLLETRAEWFMRNAARFTRALESAGRIGIRIAPFLVGIENFSQGELDRFNKGTTAAANIEFIETLWRWKERFGEALDLDHTAFGFILFTPWTTMEDLAINLAAIRRTRFDRLRGSLLLSRVRLYPDTALYYLAQRDGLLADEFASESDNASRRYGYYPSHPWQHVHADVAHFAALATEVAERNGSRDMVNVFQALLDEFQAAGSEWPAIRSGDVWQRYQRHAAGMRSSAGSPPMTAASEALRQRFARLVQPLSLDETFAGGWRFGRLGTCPGRVEVELHHEQEPSLVVEIALRGHAPHFRRSSHYDIRATGHDLTRAQRSALDALSAAIVENDS